MAKLNNITVARAAYWATVNDKMNDVVDGRSIRLTHGARISLEYPPRPPQAATTVSDD